MRRVAAMGAAMAVLAMGCTDDSAGPDDATAEDGGTEAQDTASVAEEPETPSAAEDNDDSPETEAADPEEPEDRAPSIPDTEPLVRAEHPLAAHDGTLEIELRAEEAGNLLRVAVTFTPRGIDGEDTSLAELLGAYASGNGISGRLIDPVNLLEYEAVKAAVPHGQATPAFEGQPTTLMFYFGAPTEPMETFDFLLDFAVGAPDWPGFVDVPFETA